MYNVFSDKDLITYFCNKKSPVCPKNHHIINIWAFTDIFIFFKRSACKTFILIKKQLLISRSYHGSFNSIKISNFSFSCEWFSVFLFDLTEIINRIIDKVRQMIFNLFNFSFYIFNQLISFERGIFWYSFNLYFSQTNNIFFSNFPVELWFIRFKSGINGFNNCIPGFTFFYITINSFLYKYLFERCKMELLQ